MEDAAPREDGPQYDDVPETAPPAVPPPPEARPEEDADGAGIASAGGDGDQIDPANELEIWAGRTAWVHYAGRLAGWLAGLIIVLVLLIWWGRSAEWLTLSTGALIFLGVFLLSGIWLARKPVMAVLGHRYRVTSQRLFIERGIISQTVDQTELVRVDDVRMYKSATDRLFGLGSVAVISTDATDREVVIIGIKEPDKVAEAIRTRMRTMRRKSLFVENL